MSKALKKVKAAAATWSPQNEEDVVQAIAVIGCRQRDRVRLETEMNDELAKVKALYEAKAAPHNAIIAELRDGLQIWCAANRERLTQGGKVKFHAFASGEVKWRVTPPKVTVKGVEATLDLLRRLGLQRLIRVKEEVNKEAILAEPDAVKGVASIAIDQREEFVVEPYETKLEEVL